MLGLVRGSLILEACHVDPVTTARDSQAQLHFAKVASRGFDGSGPLYLKVHNRGISSLTAMHYKNSIY